jgi:hypothetical protein
VLNALGGSSQQFQVNTYTTNHQVGPAVAMDSDGDFVVAWTSDGANVAAVDGYSIQAQLYDSNGMAQGEQILVNSYTTSVQEYPAVAMDSDGNFVVAWTSDGSSGSDSDGESIQAQRYDSSGSEVGGQFQVNTYTTSAQRNPSVAMDLDGDFVVVWRSNGSSGTDGQLESIQAQRYDNSGTPQGVEFQVNSYTTGFQQFPKVAMDNDGDFVVIWHSAGSSGTDTDGNSIQARRFNNSGVAQGQDFQVNTYTTNPQREPMLAMDADGDFVATWHSSGSSGTDSDGYSIQAQRYDSSGVPQGGEFQVNTYTTSVQRNPWVAMDRSGNFVLAWRSFGSSGTDISTSSIQAKCYDKDGAPLSGEFQVNTYTTGVQRHATVAMDASGNFVVGWRSFGSSGTDTDSFSIQAQLYRIGQIYLPIVIR